MNPLPVDFSFPVAEAISLPWCQLGNEGGGTAGSLIVLDELSVIHREYWYLDLPDPQSAECGKCEVSMGLNMCKMPEKCSSWKTFSFLRLQRCANLTSLPSLCFVPKSKFPFLHPFSDIHILIVF